MGSKPNHKRESTAVLMQRLEAGGGSPAGSFTWRLRIMSANNSIVATYANRGLAEADIKKLQEAGFDMKKLSIVGKGLQCTVGGSAGVAAAGGFDGLDTELYNCIPTEDVRAYEDELEAGRVILVAYGTADEIARAKTIIDSIHPISWDESAESAVYYGCPD